MDKKLSLRLYLDDIYDTAIYREERPTPTFNTSFTYKGMTRMIRFQLVYNFSNKNKVNKRKNTSKNDAKRRF